MTRQSWTTIAVAGLVALLPWQTRYIFGGILIDGMHTEYGVMSVFAVECLVAVLAGIVLFRIKSQALDSKVFRLFGLFGIALVLGATHAANPLFSLAILAHILCAFLLFFVIVEYYISLRALMFSFCLGLLPAILIGFTQTVLGSSPASTLLGMASRSAFTLGDAVFTVHGERVLRAYGTFSHPNVFGGYLAVALFAWWALLWLERERVSRVKYLALGGVGTAIFFGGLLLTGSRSAILGLGVGLVLILLARTVKHYRSLVLSLVAVGLVGGSLLASFLAPDLAASLRGGGVHEERSLTERIDLYKAYVPVATSMNPFFGLGVGEYVLASAAIDPGKPAYDYQPVHNAWLLLFAEVGIFGLVPILTLGALFVRRIFARLPEPLALSVLGMVSVLFCVAFYDHYLWSSWSGVVLVACVFAFSVRVTRNVN